MATYNQNSLPQPIYPSSWDLNKDPIPDIGAQTFLNCTVVSFNVTADIGTQGGRLNVNLIEDVDPVTGYRQRLRDNNIYDFPTDSQGSLPLVGSPQFFKILNNDGDVVFKFNGILKSISRTVSPNGGIGYQVSLDTPFSLLENATVILDKYPGFGFAQEGIPFKNSINSYFDINSNDPDYQQYHYNTAVCNPVTNAGLDENWSYSLSAAFNLDINEIPPADRNVGLSFSSNMRQTIWNNVYNLLNVFGFYESESHGLSTYKGYGFSTSDNGGIKLSYIITALDTLINLTPSSSDRRFFGGNLLSGTSTYNICAVRDDDIKSDPYYYGIDFTNFIIDLKSIITQRYILSGTYQNQAQVDEAVDNLTIPQTQTTIADLIGYVCSFFGIDFIVKLNEISYSTYPITNYNNGFYTPGTFILYQTSQGCGNVTSLGGIISIQLIDRSKVRCDRPFSDIAYKLLGLEIPEFGDYGLAGSEVSPGKFSAFNPAFLHKAFGPSYIDPLDNDLDEKQPEGSYPFGGKFPVATKLDSRGTLLQNIVDRVSSSQLSIVDTKAVSAKFLVGDNISRIVHVPRKYIYQYWGDIRIDPVTPDCSITKTHQRTYPVVTQILPHDDIMDHVLIDIHDIFPDGACPNIGYKGIYAASMAEIRLAMSNAERWWDFLTLFKPCKVASIYRCVGYNEEETKKSINSIYEVSINDNDQVVLDTTTVTDKNIRTSTGLTSPIHEQNTSISQIKPKADVDDYSVFIDLRTIKEKLYQKVKEIGDTHYGKTWVAWMPYIQTKVTESGENIIGNYEKSWSITDSAYLEPSGYSIINAPQSSKFVNKNRLSSYANFEYSFGTEKFSFSDAFTETGDITAFRVNNQNYYKYDFSEYNTDSISISNCSPSGFAHTKIDTKTEYLYLPYDYFTKYLRQDTPFITEKTPIGKWDKYEQLVVRDTGLIDYSSVDIYSDVPSKAGRTSSQKLANTELYNSIIDTGTPSAIGTHYRNYRADYQYATVFCNVSGCTTLVQNAIPDIIDEFLDTRYPDHGLDCFHFARFDTQRVFHPLSRSDGFKFTDGRILTDIYKLKDPGVQTPSPADQRQVAKAKQNKHILDEELLKNAAFPVCIPPFSVGIPQQSNRYTYGPWFTDNKFIYAGKVEYQQDSNLAPENYVSPVYGTLSSTDFNYFSDLSGMTGLNKAGQAFANSIDGYRLFANENGSITLPGAPLINEIGDIFFSGDPNDITYIMSMSVQASPNGMTTTYNFGSNQPRLDSIPKEYADKIKKFSDRAYLRIPE